MIVSRNYRSTLTSYARVMSCLACCLVLSTVTRAQNYTLKTIARFNGTNGAGPTGLTQDSNGNLYGTTTYGGDLSLFFGQGNGTVFKIATGTPVVTTLYLFSGSDGASPFAGLTMDANGNLYGTTTYGGDLSLFYGQGNGMVFKIAAGTNTRTTLYRFRENDGVSPFAGMIQDSSGNLYGTTQSGGDLTVNDGNGFGTVFKIATGTNARTTLVRFNGNNGANPFAGLTMDSSSNLYGTTQRGGDGYGTVFQIAAGTRTLTTLVRFNGSNGASPFADLTMDSTGNLYGTTAFGGTGYGTVFKIAAGTRTLTTLAYFNGTNGANPFAGVVLDSNGNLYGTTTYGGNLTLNDGNGYGTVFKIDAGTNKLSTLVYFNTDNGANPNAALTMDSNGNLFGTTQSGGDRTINNGNGFGTVFELILNAVNVTNQIAIQSGGFTYQRKTQTYSLPITVSNKGATAITGPVSLVFDGLSGTKMVNATGMTTFTSPTGSPYLNGVPEGLAPGASATFVLQFSARPTNYAFRILAGSGSR